MDDKIEEDAIALDTERATNQPEPKMEDKIVDVIVLDTERATNQPDKIEDDAIVLDTAQATNQPEPEIEDNIEDAIVLDIEQTTNQPGPKKSCFGSIVYCMKWISAYLTRKVKQKTGCRRFDLYDLYAFNEPVRLGYLLPRLEMETESPLPESHVRNAADEVFFYGGNSKSEHLIARIARGCNQEAEAWVYLKLENGKTYQLAQTSSYQQASGPTNKTFSCGGLQMEYLCPMRRWRIYYCGMLEEKNEDENEAVRIAFVKFTFLWKASSDLYDLSYDLNASTLADCRANMEWKFPYYPRLRRLPESLNAYFQSGVFYGLVTVDDGPNHEMFMYGERVRHLGKSAHIVGSKFKHIFGNTPKNGLSFHAGLSSLPNMFEDLSFGFVVTSSGNLKPVKKAYIDVIDTEVPTNINAGFLAGEVYEMLGKITESPILLKSRHGWIGSVEVNFISFTMGDYEGNGVFVTGDVSKVPVRDFEHQAISSPEITPLIVNFHDEVSYIPELSGGKGSSLGKLTKLSKEDKSFIVPKGIIVTTAAYSEFLNQEIEKEIQNLEDVIYEKVVGDVEETCDKVISVITRTTLPHKICREIESHLNVVFDGHHHYHKFAVRSSATNEDSEMMSAAGQMDTFLGVHGLREVFSAIKKCWASQFSYVAVEYKRHNGQPLNCPMAVVVQDMVACEVAGVLFTCDPVTSNPSTITITGNYGLGESVVCGLEEPDTFFLHRSMADEITLKSLTIGSKNHRIVMQDDGGVIREDVPEEERNHCCLSNEMAEKLGRIAIKIEKYYKSPRDIEWGIENENIYVLQSRPVTSRSGETDFEIKHEFDAPMRCEREYFSVCNIGEVLPGATTPLSIDLWFKYFRTILTKVAETKKQTNTLLPHRYFESGCVSYYNHMMMSVIDVISRMHGHNTLRSQGITIGIFGRLLEDEEIFQAADERYKNMSGGSLKSYYHFLKDLFFAPYGEKLLRKYLERDFFSADFCTTSEEIFSAILSSCSVFDEALDLHISSTEGSSAWNMFLFTLLGNAKGGYDTDVYSDFARLLSVSKNVESADIPSTMQNLAHLVLSEMTSNEFKAMPVEKALAWFQKSTSEAGRQFRQFLKRHGHRCLKEFDMQSKSWAMDPKPLVQFLQNLSGTCESPKEKRDDDIEKILSELQVPLDFRKRCLVKFLLPHCRRAVGERERCKSLLIKAFDNWRKGFRNLSRLMVFEGRIPDADLIYFLTIDEIKDLLRTRSPKIIQRASHRRKLFPVLDKYIFPEIMKGQPKPVNEEDSEENFEYVSDLIMEGIPVSQGVTKGYARVAITLEDAAQLEPGEVLITYCTDIGWSPYFPILSGVATELGGLISHGAVVSREYGLPCVVGLRNATKLFQTGDFVLLDGKRGVLQRLPNLETD